MPLPAAQTTSSLNLYEQPLFFIPGVSGWVFFAASFRKALSRRQPGSPPCRARALRPRGFAPSQPAPGGASRWRSRGGRARSAPLRPRTAPRGARPPPQRRRGREIPRIPRRLSPSGTLPSPCRRWAPPRQPGSAAPPDGTRRPRG